ncbi:hypothetical protein HWI79_1522 [Cryptosporidium felis]|nr:hypothetical protein HWI79_1522 [Cryptosporidium felis]
MNEKTNSQQNNRGELNRLIINDRHIYISFELGVFPTHPFITNTSTLRKETNLTHNIRPFVDEYVQLIQFWQFNVGGTCEGSTETPDFCSIESQDILKEYLYSLLEIQGDNADKRNPFFADELLSDSLNIKRRNGGNSLRPQNLLKRIDSTKKLSVNDEDNFIFDVKDTNNDDIDALESEEESEFDYDYMNPEINEDYDELEDNTNDNDAI